MHITIKIDVYQYHYLKLVAFKLERNSDKPSNSTNYKAKQ